MKSNSLTTSVTSSIRCFLPSAFGVAILFLACIACAHSACPQNVESDNSVAGPCEPDSPYGAENLKTRICSARSPREKLLTKIKLTELLRSSDLQLALDQCNEVIELAKKFGYQDILDASLFDSASIRAAMHGENKVESKLDFSKFKLDDSASPNIRLHFALSKLNLEVQMARIQSNFLPLLDEIEEAANQCNDKDLLARRCSLELLVRVYFMNQTLNDKTVVRLRNDLNVFVNAETHPHAKIISLLMEAREARMDHQNFEIEVACYEAAKSLAKKLGNRELVVRSGAYKSFVVGKQKFYKESMACLEEVLPVAMDRKSDPCIRKLYKRMAYLFGRMGRIEDKFSCLKKVERSKTFLDQELFAQHQHASAAFSSALHLDKNEEANAYRSKMVRTEFVQEHLRNKKKLAEQSKTVYENSQSDEQPTAPTSSSNSQRAQSATSSNSDQNLSASALLLWSLFAFTFVAIFLVRQTKAKAIMATVEQESATLEPANRHLRSQRMESLGQMAGAVAHDFNNILVGVLGNAEIIQLTNDPETQPQVYERVNSIIESAARAADLSHQMLAYSGKQFISKVPCDLNEIVAKTEATIDSICNPEQSIDVEYFQNTIPVKVDIAQVERVLLNLITNALAVSPIDSCISIRTGFQTIEDFEFDHSFFGPRNVGGEFGFVEVVDRGGGISEAELERIFEPFYSTSKGKGFGLAVVYGIVAGHDGLVQCRSTPEENTTFRVFFPLAPEPESEGKQSIPITNSEFQPISAKVDHSTNSLAGNTILVIDDERSVLDHCQRLFDHAGLKTIVSLGGKSGLENIIDYQDEISCILMDISMPEMGANEILAELESRQIEIPVVLMTGHSDTKLELFSKHPPVVAVVQKPFSCAEMREAIEKGILIYLEQSASANQSVFRESKSTRRNL